MIRSEIVGERVRHYSDDKYKIRQIETGVLYDDAVDVIPCRFTYEESRIPIEFSTLPDNFEESAQYLMDEGLVELPEEEEPDYLNENEPEPDYFA